MWRDFPQSYLPHVTRCDRSYFPKVDANPSSGTLPRPHQEVETVSVPLQSGGF